MSVAVIIGNGDFPRKEFPRALLRQADLVVCCDGGVSSFLRNRARIFSTAREPDLIIGDMDSIPRKLAGRYSTILIHSSDQETNDQTKAFRHIVENHPEVSTVHILAGTGKREDHTVANLSLLMDYASKYGASGNPSEDEVFVDMVSDHSTAFALTDSCDLHIGAGRSFSLFSPDNSLRIESSGLVWPTGGVVFDNWWKASLNKSSQDVVSLSFSHRSVALVVLD